MLHIYDILIYNMYIIYISIYTHTYIHKWVPIYIHTYPSFSHSECHLCVLQVVFDRWIWFTDDMRHEHRMVRLGL